jgi:prepilin-type N-terminal cleavage/methylation domain-containing protein
VHSSSRSRAGFTLVELMVALLITGAMVAAVFQLLNGQSRMVAVQSARQEAQQNVRGALEVVSSELRAAIPGAILEARPQLIRFMQPRAWGVVCQVAGNVVTAVFPTTGALDGWTVNTANGVLVNTGDLAVPSWQPNPHTPAARARITAVQQLATANTAPCNGMNAQGGAVAVSITTSAGVVGAVRGDMVVTYTLTQYDLGQDGTGSWWLQRNNGLNPDGTVSQQPMAGPLEQDRFAFTYFAGNPAAPVAAPGTTQAQLAALRMVGVQVVTSSSQRLNNRAQRDSGAVRVMLRN